MRTESGRTGGQMRSEAPQYDERSTIGFEGSGVFVTEQSESEVRCVVHERIDRLVRFWSVGIEVEIAVSFSQI
jgi:hypothetical protein